MNSLPGTTARNSNRPGRQKCAAAVLLAAILISAPFAAQADEHEDLEKLRATMLSLIDTLVKNHILPRDKADEMMREAEAKANSSIAQSPPPEIGPDGKKIVRVPYIPEAVKVQMHDQIKAEVLAETRNERAAVPGVDTWLDRFQFDGDLRLREEATRLVHGNTPPAALAIASSNLTRAPDIWGNTSNGIHNFDTQENATRTRVRARLNVTAKVSDTVSAGVTLATGGTTGPTSTNQTMGQGFNKYSVVFDRAFIKYDPESWLSMSGGRIANPFFATDLVWADDLNFEGAAMTFKHPTDPLSSIFFTAGWFPLSFSVPQQTTGRSLIALQGGMEQQIGEKDSHVKVAAALYNYLGIEGVAQTQDTFLSSPDYLASEYSSGYRQRGNTLFRINAPLDSATNWGLASGFRELDITGTVDLDLFDPAHVVLTGDVVRNLDFNRNKIEARTGAAITDGKSLGYLWRAQFGSPKTTRRGDWNVSLAYRYLGSDAVLDAFTNSDFGLGGTNSKGTILGMNYGVDKNAWVSARWMSSNLIDSLVPVTAAGSTDTKFAVDLFQFDLNAKF